MHAPRALYCKLLVDVCIIACTSGFSIVGTFCWINWSSSIYNVNNFPRNMYSISNFVRINMYIQVLLRLT